LIPRIISTLTSLKLEVIDNRSWHPRGVDSTLMTEIFLQDDCFLKGKDEEGQKTIDERIAEVHETMTKAIRQKGAKVKVTRWFPGVLQTISEEVKSKSSSTSVVISRKGSVRDMIASEATKNMESKRNNQLDATKEKTLDDIKKEMGIPLDTPAPAAKEPVLDSMLESSKGSKPPPKTTLRRVRQKNEIYSCGGRITF